MSGSQEQPWSGNPNAPKISHDVYLREKAWFTGILVGAILYGTCKISTSTGPLSVLTAVFIWFILGVLIVLFFECMTALFNPVYRRGEGIKWGLVSYTMITFSLVTVHFAMNAYVLSISYIDNREFGVAGEASYGPYGYQAAINFKAISVIPRAAFRLNNWSADGLLVSSLFGAMVAYLTPAPLLALPLLPILLHEPLGHRLPLPHVPWFRGYVFGFSTSAGDTQC